MEHPYERIRHWITSHTAHTRQKNNTQHLGDRKVCVYKHSFQIFKHSMTITPRRKIQLKPEAKREINRGRKLGTPLNITSPDDTGGRHLMAPIKTRVDITCQRDALGHISMRTTHLNEDDDVSQRGRRHIPRRSSTTIQKTKFNKTDTLLEQSFNSNHMQRKVKTNLKRCGWASVLENEAQKPEIFGETRATKHENQKQKRKTRARQQTPRQKI